MPPKDEAPAKTLIKVSDDTRPPPLPPPAAGPWQRLGRGAKRTIFPAD